VSDKDPFDIPEPFHMRIKQFWDHMDERRGAIGRVYEPEHTYDGYWVVISTRHVGVFKLYDPRSTTTNIALAPREPRLQRQRMAALWYWRGQQSPRRLLLDRRN